VHVPRRRCVGCGRIAPKSELMRLVAVREGAGSAALAMHDPSGTAPGRGAYLCRGESAGAPDASCLERARRRGAVGRALRCPVTIPSEGLESVSR
jgi:predicted RNA-binding protein YlxR (DUF448 family)